MSYDISTELDIIKNSVRGEDVRDAIISLFGKVNESSIGVTLTTAEYKELSDEEKNNGTMYFVSDMSIEDGEETYYGNEEGESSHVLITKETALGIVNAVRTLMGIDSNVKLSDVPSFITSRSMLIPRYKRLLTGSYNNGTTWYHYPNATAKYVIDIYKVPVGKKYLIGIGGKPGNRFYSSLFKTDPYAASGNITGGTSMTTQSNPVAFADYRINITWSDVDYAYIVIQVSNNSNTDTDSFVIDTEAFTENIEAIFDLDDEDDDEE